MPELTTPDERAEHKQIMERIEQLDGKKLNKAERTELIRLQRRRKKLLDVVSERRRAGSYT